MLGQLPSLETWTYAADIRIIGVDGICLKSPRVVQLGDRLQQLRGLVEFVGGDVYRGGDMLPGS